MLLAVHYRPDSPPHDVVLELGSDRTWRVPLEEWAEWTPRPANLDPTSAGAPLALLKPSAAFAMRLDACTSELWVDADPERGQTTDLNRPTPHAVARAGYGGFANIDLAYGGLAGRNAIDSLLDLGAFAPGGAGRTQFFVGNDAVRRLDTTWIHDEPGLATRLRVGDSITHNADWETPVRFGGVQWGTDFSLQPDRITFPLPTINGSAALASTAQLYVNGIQQSQLSLQPGHFRFDSVPTLTGAGDLSVVIRDSLGREQTVTQPFYASPRLLAAGLDAGTAEFGLLRQNYASVDDHYSNGFAAATVQHGYTDTFTGLLRASIGQRRQLTGVEGDYILSPFGVFTVSGAASNTEAGWGGVGTLAFERQADGFSLSLRRRAATRSYGDLGREPGTLHFSDAARASWNIQGAGMASLVYISEQPWNDGPQASGIRLAGISLNAQPLSDLSVYASWLHPLNGRGGNNLVIGFSLALGRGTSAGMQATRNAASDGASVAIQHSPPERLGWSYSASVDGQYQGLRQAQAQLTTEHGTLGAGYAGFGGNGSPSFLARTGFAFLDGNGYWTRPVENTFAVVDAGAADIRVYRENQWVGSTDSNGRLLVPDLLPFSVNRLSIDGDDLPIAMGLAASAVQVAPPANAGVTVHFEVDERPPLRLQLRVSGGAFVPAGATVWLDGRLLPLPVGYDGLVYVAAAQGTHFLEARWPDGRCRLRIGGRGEQGEPAACTTVAP